MRIIFSIRSLLLALGMFLTTAGAFAQVGVAVSVTVAPPELPVYDQPICPGDGYIWTPGYWAYGDDDYYWVPGTWIMPPEVGLLWTPGYWGWADSGFTFYDGYWGPEVGFYGGISYGFGYFGHGFEGGRWDNGHFLYNRAVANVDVNIIHNTYNTTVVNNTTVNRVSFNGGKGGVNARPTSQEQAVAQQRHIPPVAAQTQHVQAARSNPELRASANHGKPPIAATAKPGAYSGQGVVAAKEGGRVNSSPTRPENNSTGAQNNAARADNNAVRAEDNAARTDNNATRGENNAARPNPVHASDLPAPARPAAPNTGNAQQDQKYQQQQDKLVAKQTQERQKLQQKQDQDHKKLEQQKANDAKKQQVEQKHQQQTQQLAQKHTEQQQQLQTRQQPAPSRPPEARALREKP
jgi:hypothetical protein